MLRQRVVTSFALLFVILGAVFLLPAGIFDLFIALVIGLAIWEWSSLSSLDSLPARAAYVAAMVTVIAVITHLYFPLSFILVLGACFWAGALVLVCLYPAGKRFWANRPALFLIALPLFLPGWLSLVYLRYQEYHAFHILLLLALVSAADIGAYFAGRAFGRHKLAPRVSPNKTVEGFIGGLLACCALILVVALLFITQTTDLTPAHWLKLLFAALLIAASSVVGDLFESMVKRYRDVKDSGNLLPGHGGMLDRIDGLTAAAPVYGLLLMFLQQDFL